MPRRNGYSLRGERCIGVCDWHAKGRINAIGALLGKVLLTVGLFCSNINSDIFYAWIKQDLLPQLTEKSVIIMDNAKFHKRADIQKVIHDSKHTLMFLPKYSPDLNPIEQKWAQAKAIRKNKDCNVDDIFKYYI